MESVRRFFQTFENPAALLVVVVAVLMTSGLVMVYSASGTRAGLERIRVQAQDESRTEESYRFHHDSSYLVKQVMWGVIGIAACIVLIRIPVEHLEKLAVPIFILSVILLLLVVFSPLGVEAKGAKRWLRVGPLTIQPSEFAKIGLVIYMAKFLADRREKITSLYQGFLPATGVLGIFSILILLEKDLGTTVLMGGVIVGMWALARVKVAHLFTLAVAAVPFLVLMIMQHGYRQARILAFLNPEAYATTHAYQLNQSLIAVGSGGIFGSGLGLSLQKYHFLSEAHTDFIFAIVCEELGLVGALSICLLFCVFILIGFRISYQAPDYFSGLMAAGLTLIVGCAAFMNFFVVLGLAPTKGLALPFFSYGGSSLIASLICAALLVNISNYSHALRGSREVF